ncbi:MAG: hypothetical protein H0X39_16845 [Actinobacteria bacterium]|nr:hypothetical protein [Actinomycetota bacterium]
MTGSSIPKLKAALTARLRADPLIGGSGVQVWYGDEYPTPVDAENITLGGTKDADPFRGDSTFGAGQSAAAIGKRSREERYALDVIVRVRAHGRTPQQGVTERAFTLEALVESSIQTWSSTTPSAFGGVVDGAFITSVTHIEGLVADKADQRGCDITLTVACRKRLATT